MKNKVIILATLLVLVIHPKVTLSQSTLDSLLISTLENNKSIIAFNQFVEAKKLEFKTGLTIDNPTFEYDFMQGTPVNAGNQTDITAIQTFDFPTVYFKKKGISNLNIEKLDLLSKGFNQEILLEVKSQYLVAVYLNKQLQKLVERKKQADKLQLSIQKKMEMGSASILDLNKIKAYQIGVQQTLNNLKIEMNTVNNKLTELNGNITFPITDSVFFRNDTIGELSEILSEATNGDYKLKSIQQDVIIGDKQVELSKAMSMPKLEVGYRHQAILGQNFNGFHTGISIPLFENKNKVKAAKAKTVYYQLLEESHQVKHHTELESKYEKVITLRNSLDEYEKLINTLNPATVLNKALELGEISLIEYFMELRYFQQTFDDYRKLELEYQLELAELMSYRL